MDHDGAVLLAVLSGVLQFKPLRQLAVQLDGAALPGAAQGIGQMEVQLGAIEGAVAGVDGVFLADAGDGVGKRGGGDVPILDGADVILRHGGQLYLIGQTEERIDLVKELRDADDLVLDLLGSEEDMRVVLSEAADAEHTVQRTGELVAVDKAELAEA